MTDIPLVSISCITFNHAPYLRECFEGFLMQQTAFKFEVVVHDDASTDGTREVIEEYTEKHPDIFVPMYQTENQYSKGIRGMMARFNFPRCRGKYIALCEGDDYWTDPFKLQKQVDFLESNPDFALCHTAVKLLENNEEKDNFSIKQWNHLKDDLGYQFALFSPLAFTCTALFRNISFINYNEYNIVSGDWMLWVKITLTGKAKFLNETTAVYRQGVGVSVGAVWQKDFNYRARFLLNQLSFNLSLKKNIWIIKGAIYFQLMFFAYKYDMNIFNKIANKFKYNINANRL